MKNHQLRLSVQAEADANKARQACEVDVTATHAKLHLCTARLSKSKTIRFSVLRGIEEEISEATLALAAIKVEIEQSVEKHAIAVADYIKVEMKAVELREEVAALDAERIAIDEAIDKVVVKEHEAELEVHRQKVMHNSFFLLLAIFSFPRCLLLWASVCYLPCFPASLLVIASLPGTAPLPHCPSLHLCLTARPFRS